MLEYQDVRLVIGSELDLSFSSVSTAGVQDEEMRGRGEGEATHRAHASQVCHHRLPDPY